MPPFLLSDLSFIAQFGQKSAVTGTGLLLASIGGTIEDCSSSVGNVPFNLRLGTPVNINRNLLPYEYNKFYTS